MKTVIISPFSRGLRNGARNPKNYPHWKEVVTLLRENSVKVIQVGVEGEEDIGADEWKKNMRLADLTQLVKSANTWAAVDNFFPHMAATIKKKGVAIFGRSDPAIFGYPDNLNLLKNKECLRPNQWELWEQDSYRDDVWVTPDIVCLAIFSLL